MPIEEDILKLLPIGQEYATSSRLLWEQLGVWAPSSIKLALGKLADGRLSERSAPDRGRRTTLYFRLSG